MRLDISTCTLRTQFLCTVHYLLQCFWWKICQTRRLGNVSQFCFTVHSFEPKLTSSVYLVSLIVGKPNWISIDRRERVFAEKATRYVGNKTESDGNGLNSSGLCIHVRGEAWLVMAAVCNWKTQFALHWQTCRKSRLTKLILLLQLSCWETRYHRKIIRVLAVWLASV